jgi:hypothetical protein
MAPPDALTADGFVLEEDPPDTSTSEFVYREEQRAALHARWHSSRWRAKPRRWNGPRHP